MKFFIIILFLGYIQNSFSQVNNSENSLTVPDSTTITTANATDSIKKEIVSNDTTKILPEDKIGVLINLKELGKTQTSGNAELLIGIGSGLIINFYGIVPALISSLIPTRKSEGKVEILIENNPNLTYEDIKQYKSGARKKRVSRAVVGTLIGSATQFILVIGFIIYLF